MFERHAMLRSALIGPNGLRAGWRLLIFFALLLPLGYGANRVIDFALRTLHLDFSTPAGGTVVMAGLAAALLLTSWIMARIESRSIADYGLPWRRAFCLQFWQGAAISFASFTALLVVLHFAGVLSFGTPMLHGADIWKYGLLWMVHRARTSSQRERSRSGVAHWRSVRPGSQLGQFGPAGGLGVRLLQMATWSKVPASPSRGQMNPYSDACSASTTT